MIDNETHYSLEEIRRRIDRIEDYVDKIIQYLDEEQRDEPKEQLLEVFHKRFTDRVNRGR